MATADAGIRLACPGCGETVLQKAMIPMLGTDGHGLRYLCCDCARREIETAAGAGDETQPEGASAG